MVACDWGTIFEKEPTINFVFDMPIGTDLTSVYEKEHSVMIGLGGVLK